MDMLLLVNAIGELKTTTELDQTGKSLLKIIKSYFGTDDNWQQYVDFSVARPGQDVRYALNDEKLRSLGWSPKRSFDDEIGDIVNYHKKEFRW